MNAEEYGKLGRCSQDLNQKYMPPVNLVLFLECFMNIKDRYEEIHIPQKTKITKKRRLEKRLGIRSRSGNPGRRGRGAGCSSRGHREHN